MKKTLEEHAQVSEPDMAQAQDTDSRRHLEEVAREVPQHRLRPTQRRTVSATDTAHLDASGRRV